MWDLCPCDEYQSDFCSLASLTTMQCIAACSSPRLGMVFPGWLDRPMPNQQHGDFAPPCSCSLMFSYPYNLDPTEISKCVTFESCSRATTVFSTLSFNFMCAICIRVSSSKVLVLIGLNGFWFFFSIKIKYQRVLTPNTRPSKPMVPYSTRILLLRSKKKGGNAAQANATSALKNGRIFSSSRFDVR